MSEKRFVCIDIGYGDDWHITDNGERLSEMEIVDLLNELFNDNRQLKKLLKRDNEKFGKCWDRIYSLEKENEQLREINKEIGDDLYNCRLNKNIISEKLKLWQDAHKEYDIYNIKDFEELMKNDK